MRRLLERANLSVRDLARMTEVCERQIHRYMGDQVFPPWHWRAQLARALHRRRVDFTADNVGMGTDVMQ